MKEELFEKIISELKPYLFNINLYFRGEPLVHPGFFSFVSMARGIGITVSTNGHFLSEENTRLLASSGIRKLIISLDGMNQTAYSAYRKGGDVNIVLDGIRRLAKAIRESRSCLKPEIQFLVNRHNEHQIGEVSKFASENGMKVHLKSMQIVNPEGFEMFLPTGEKFRRYVKTERGYRLKSRMRNRCLRLWMNPVITWDGEVLPCCFDKNAGYGFGNMSHYSFREIWQGERSMEFRQKLLSGRGNIDICTNCTSGLYGAVI